jgi:16S rRNA (uracil1498-N3)-methyltransferase
MSSWLYTKNENMQILTRIYWEFPNSSSWYCSDTKKYHQITRVLRAKIWQNIECFTDSIWAIFEITSIDKKGFHCRRIEHWESQKTPTFHCCIAHPNKIEKLEWIIQKGSELGVTHFRLFASDHSQIKIIPEKKIQRLKEIAQEAIEQSGRYQLPEICWVAEIPTIAGMCILSQHGIKNQNPSSFSGICIGPEGGWSAKEMEYFSWSHIPILTINNGILRMETAAIAGIALCKYE